MEPRPSRPSRATTGQPSTKSTRTPWTPSPTVEPATAQRTADIYSAPASQSGAQWYGQPPTYAPDQGDYRQTGPITPIKPRNERGNKLLRYLLASLLLIAVIGGGAYAITRLLDDNDAPDDAQVAAVTETTVTPTSAPAEQTEGPNVIPTATSAESAPTPTPDAPVATEAPVEADAAAAEATVASASSDQTATDSAESYLPDPEDIEGNWNVVNEGERTKAEVGEAIGPDGEAQLTSWRWRENYFRELTRTDPESFPDETTFISVSAHRFANADGAAEALTALSDIVVSAQGLQDVEAPAIGDQARALSGPGDGVNLYVLYVQDGKYLIRLGGSSVTGDPAETINTLAEQILANQDQAS